MNELDRVDPLHWGEIAVRDFPRRSLSESLASEARHAASRIKNNIKKLRPWQFFLIGIVLSEVLTLVFSMIISTLLWNKVHREVILVGLADAFLVPLIVVPVVILFFFRQTDKMAEANRRLEEEIQERKKAEDKLRVLSLTDDLTGLYNRRGFFTMAEDHLKLARRLNKGVLLLYADFDNLKGINDAFGHEEGDAALIETAHIFRKCYRESDILARIGGDEFVVVSLESSRISIDMIRARLQTAIEKRNAERSPHHPLSISTGIAYAEPGAFCSITGLLSRADELMFEVKKEKKKT